MTDALHLLPQFRKYLEMSDARRVAEIQDDSHWVDYPQSEAIFKTVDNMLSLPARSQAPCLLVYGDGGTGKSSIAARMKKFPRFRDKLIYIDLSVKIDGAKFPKLISMALDAPYELMRESRVPRFMPIELERIIKLRGVRGIVFDELHDAFLVPRLEQQKNLSIIKGLSNSPFGITIIGFGTSSANNSIKSDEQFYRRFNVVELSDWSAGDEFRSFLVGIESQLPLRRPSFLDSEDLCAFILERTGGRMDSVVKLVRAAACYAIVSGEEAVTRHMLVKAFADPWGY